MIAALSPANYNYDETLSTLRYASRAKSITNKPIVNEDPKDALLKQYEDEIQKLKKMLQNVNNGVPIIDSINSMKQRQSIKIGQTNKQEDESVEALIAKLNMKGAKVKILKDGEEETP